jgi:thiol-disulfide isomerase/thioredoxin
MRVTFTSGRTDRRRDASRIRGSDIDEHDRQHEGGNGMAHPDSVRDNRPMRIASAVLFMLGACGAAQRDREVDQPLPALTLPLIDGGTWSSTAPHDVLVIDIWASWCKPCGKAFPKLDALARDAKTTVVAISIDEDPDAIRAYLAEFPLGVPVAHDAKQTVTGPPLRIAHLPSVLVIDRDGIIRRRLTEPSDHDYDQLGDIVALLRTR